MIQRIITFYRRYLKRRAYGWFGDYGSWQQAQQNCTGYDSSLILQKVKEAVLKVKNGKAVYERDGVVFDTIEYSWPLLSALLWVAVKNNGRLHVIDFGGSLGSTYFQNKKFLDSLGNTRWNIIEQENFVQTGRASIQDDTLRFYADINECIAQQGKPDILILSCVMQYIEKPYDLISNIMAHDIRFIIIDNTPFNFVSKNRLTVQKVPPSIYTASYPCWFLDYKMVKESFEKRYTLVSEHENDTRIELDGRSVQYKGFLLELKK
ncbi:MAG TPA: methyltransferase, TIGR04325 family [Chitinophagaceae bacterium]|nr:methyltransferase, TIGR04325 family [Chitinophagaceae bacterium]